MVRRCVIVTVVAGAILAQAPQLLAGEGTSDLSKGIKDLEIGALWYLSYQHGEDNGESGVGEYNLFTVRRGYINVKKKMTPWLEARITPDVHQDFSGDMNVRLKYAYAKFKFPTKGAIYNPWLEFRQVHMPWLDMVLVDVERVSFADDSRDDDWRVQTTVQIHYP